MLQLKKIRKTYRTGELCQDALKEVSIRFRENEFVSILGPSGSGKTTLLNIVGGLDRYDSGDLVINGVSTKQYRDGDWDYYRNHSIGFVFQSYNLIPHQSVLANVELALTLSGVGKRERRQRAQAVLRKVGLGDHLHKRPNQLSGGQMQRVAIARALVNDPDILLADEPTGALDSETSVQIMELLKEIARDKLVIMVTHNPELADRYSTRIVRLLDGQIVDDTRPLTEEEPERSPQKRRKISMSFGTALALSFNNLRTKKGRTLLTAFAGSIGIIGIALILALSTGMDRYITDVQKDTMSSYPVTITDQTFDVSSLIGIQGEVLGEDSREEAPDTSSAHADFRALESAQAFASSIVENDLTGFKSYLEDQDSPIHQYLGENGVVYGYDVNFSVYAYDPEGEWVNTSEALGEEDSDSMMDRMHSITLGAGSESAAHFSQMTPGQNGEAVSQVVTDNYQLLYGAWPQKAHEVVLVLNSRNAIPATTLRQLGFLTEDQYDQALEAIEAGRGPGGPGLLLRGAVRPQLLPGGGLRPVPAAGGRHLHPAGGGPGAPAGAGGGCHPPDHLRGGAPRRGLPEHRHLHRRGLHRPAHGGTDPAHRRKPGGQGPGGRPRCECVKRFGVPAQGRRGKGPGGPGVPGEPGGL